MRTTLVPAALRTGFALAAAAGLTLTGLTLAPAAGAAPADGTAPAPGPTAVAPSSAVTTARSCAASRRPATMSCSALRVTAGMDGLAHSTGSVDPADTPSGYGPADLRAAYGLPATGAAGTTIAVVDAYDDPNAESDLATYRSTFGLPTCGSASGCFTKVGQTGTATLPRADAGWAEEISLDLDMVSAICPQCRVLLVEARSSSMADLGTAVNTAVAMGAKYVSNSWGGGESSSDASYDSAYFNHPGVAITVSSGDSGYGAEYPAASRYVTAVGGTSLRQDSSARGWSESVWSGTGSGCSAYDTKPTWQTDTGCTRRSIADVAAVADPATGVAVYDTYGGDTGWEVFGGTSASAPIVAAVYALAGTPSAGSSPASFPYAHAASLHDVTTGSNGSCAARYLCNGTLGYDGPTGLGTPNGTSAFAG
ncbi:S53 family peptidase [Actinacidiphila acididurans]|uniref:Peptidase S8 n=1 Tax=Actinacidiphila acididurans TaxID=2784346 RepID=A0ABS2TR48_9ACTN|nr:S8 family serine peptidase [Actinacidiphila acididurans]MBM9505557.1 peptidase S8 [Actinacidiphila acididurans]